MPCLFPQLYIPILMVLIWPGRRLVEKPRPRLVKKERKQKENRRKQRTPETRKRFGSQTFKTPTYYWFGVVMSYIYPTGCKSPDSQTYYHRYCKKWSM